jgi:hypothetical protein
LFPAGYRLGIVTIGDGDEPGYDGMVIQSLVIEEL